MDLKQLFMVVRHRWISVVSVLVLALVASVAVSLSTTPQYAARARVLISVDASSPAEALAGSMFSAARVQSYASLMKGHDLLHRVARKLGSDMTSRRLGKEIAADVEQGTTIIDVRVHDPSPARARRIADAAAVELARYVGDLEKPVGKAKAAIRATVVDTASVNHKPVSPRTWLNLTVAAFLGLLLGLALALVRDLLDNTINSREDLDATIDAPMLGHLERDADVRKHPLLTQGAPDSPRFEAFRVMRSNLQFLDLDSPPRAIVITSSVPNEGKTSTAVNLAISMAQTGQRVLLVEGDLRDPKLAGTLGLRRTVGMTTALIGSARLEDCIQHHRESGVDLLAGGQTPPNPAELLQSDAVEALLDHLRSTYDRIVIDAPPLLPVADAAVLTRHVDGAILVVCHGRTSRSEAAASKERLDTVGGRLLGVVLNMTPRRSSRAYTYPAVATATQLHAKLQ